MKRKIRWLLSLVLITLIVLGLAAVVAATESNSESEVPAQTETTPETETPVETEHTHNWQIQYISDDGHHLVCFGCDATKLEEHTLDSTETCVSCGQYVHIHNWQCAWSDDYWHCIVCSGCGDEKTTAHSKNSEGICTICGHTPHEHIWQYNDGQNYDYNHGLRCTQCAATTTEDHIYGNDGKCTVCGNAPPHVHQWEWDGNKSNHVWDHIVVCSCGAEKTERHQLYAWDGKIGSDRWHRELCGICGFALLFDHLYDSAYFNGERCTVCGYPAQGATEPGVNPGETTPVETTPTETRPEETIPVETMPSGTEPDETIPTNVTKEDSQRSSFVWVWVAAILVFAGGLGTVVFFVKKKSS